MSFLTRILTGTALAAGLGLVALPVSAVEYRMAVGDGAGSAQEALGKAFVAKMEELSGGDMTAKLFLNGQLGDEQATVTAAATGTLDFSIIAINNIMPFSPEVGVLTLPYVMLSVEDAETLTKGELGDRLTEVTVENAGIRILGWSYSGFRVLSNSKHPVASVADLSDLVIRVPQNAIQIAIYQAWGISPSPMAWTETFAALQQKVLDGQDNPYLTIYSMKFDEVQNYITPLRHIFSLEPLVISEALFQDLSPEQQDIMIQAGKAATEYSGQYLRAEEAKIRDELVARGMEITEPADGEQEFIELATSKVWPQFYDQIGGIEVLNDALAQLGRDPAQ